MKSYVSTALISTILFFSQSGFAIQKFEFKFAFEGEKLAISQEAPDYYVALEKAAKSCFRHFKGKVKSGRDKGIDLIDVCANPKS